MKIKKVLSLALALLCVIEISPLLSQCYPDRHNTSLDASWLSCRIKTSPNPARGSGHWIHYELDEKRTINTIKLWNINHPDHLRSGARTITIDYQKGLGDWVHHGTYDLERAEASGFYEGEDLDMLSEFVADNILITITENYGGSCSGIAEIRVGTTEASTTSVEDVAYDHFDIQISPNPFDEYTDVAIDGLDGRVIRYDIINNLGQTVASQNVTTSGGTTNFRINGDLLQAGMYYLKITDGLKVSSRKLSYQTQN